MSLSVFAAELRCLCGRYMIAGVNKQVTPAGLGGGSGCLGAGPRKEFARLPGLGCLARKLCKGSLQEEVVLGGI